MIKKRENWVKDNDNDNIFGQKQCDNLRFFVILNTQKIGKIQERLAGEKSVNVP